MCIFMRYRGFESHPLRHYLAATIEGLQMSHPIRIKLGDVELEAELNNTRTAEKILGALPLKSRFNSWGDEIYFQIGVDSGPEDPQETVSVGDLAFWPPGKAFCIFYGQTPASEGDEIRPASPVNTIGRVLDDATVIKEVPRDTEIVVESAS